jgi:hypothetical protein
MTTLLRIFSLAISLSLFPITVCAVSPWDVAGCLVLACVPSIVKGSIDDTADHLTGDAKSLYLDVMNDFVSTKLPQMLSGIDSLASKHETAIKDLVAEINSISNSLIQAINSGVKNVDVLVKHTFKLADLFVDKIACDAEGTTANAAADAQAGLQKIIDRYLPSWFTRRDQCEVRYGTPDIHTPTKVISLRDCEFQAEINKLDPNSINVQEIRNDYADLLDLIFIIKCLPHATEEVDALNDLETAIRGEYQTWNDALGASIR